MNGRRFIIGLGIVMALCWAEMLVNGQSAAVPFNFKYKLQFEQPDYTNLIGARVYVHNSSGLVRTVTFTNSAPTGVTNSIPIVFLMAESDPPGLYILSAESIDKLSETSVRSTNVTGQLFGPPLPPGQLKIIK
jgi:hypothetical protein